MEDDEITLRMDRKGAEFLLEAVSLFEMNRYMLKDDWWKNMSVPHRIYHMERALDINALCDKLNDKIVEDRFGMNWEDYVKQVMEKRQNESDSGGSSS